jgi:hypothetical protein
MKTHVLLWNSDWNLQTPRLIIMNSHVFLLAHFYYNQHLSFLLPFYSDCIGERCAAFLFWLYWRTMCACATMFFVVAKHSITQTLIRSPLWTYAHTPCLYEDLRRLSRETDPVNLEIDEVTTGSSLSTETSSSTKRIIHLFTRHQNVKPGVWSLVGSGGATPKLCSQLTTQLFDKSSWKYAKNNWKFIEIHVFDYTTSNWLHSVDNLAPLLLVGWGCHYPPNHPTTCNYVVLALSQILLQ